MNARKAITMADNLRMNAIGDEQKYAWLFELEGQVAQFMKEPIPRNCFPDDTELLMPIPYENIYVYYLCAMIDYFQQEIDLYENDMQMFNQLMNDSAGWWHRTNPTGSKGRWKVM